MLTVIGAIAEFERANLLERQREGIAEAVKEGKYKGRKEVRIDNFDEAYARYVRREVNKTQLAKELGISRPTLDKLIERHKQSHLTGIATVTNISHKHRQLSDTPNMPPADDHILTSSVFTIHQMVVHNPDSLQE